MNDESANEKERAASQTALPLKIIEDMLHNRISQKKEEIHKTTQSIADTERLWTEIDTLRWYYRRVLASDDNSVMGDTITRKKERKKKERN